MDLSPFQLERYFAQHEFSAPYLLCCSDCESMTTEELLGFESEAKAQLLSLWLGYTESLGNPRLRQEITALYRNIKSTEILVHTGAEEAIFNFMNVTLRPGDHIMVHAPFYQSLGEVARSIGAQVTPWMGSSNNSGILDLAFLKDNLTDRTKVVVINFPHNPTGFLPDAAFLQDLSKLSDKHGFVVFSDEVYRGLEYDRAMRLPAFADLNERAVSLGVMSKTYGLAGLRIGWLATRNLALYHKLASFKDYTTICNSAPSEFLAALALRHRHKIVERNLAIIRSNLAQLRTFFDLHSDLFQWNEPKAGPIAFPRYRGGSVDRFCKELLSQKGVLLLPGTLYNKDSNCFRIGFGRKNMPDSLARFSAFLESRP